MKENKVLLVTGASSDIGCNLIENIEKNYDKIVAHYFHLNHNLECLKERLADRMVLLQADFTDVQSSSQFIDDLKNLHLTVDHFVHLPAEGIQQKKFVKLQWEQFDREIQLSLRSFVEVAKILLPNMAKQKYGKILVMLSSCTVGTPPKYLSSYVTQKYALLGLLKSLSCEYADKGITVNGVSPEMIETKFLAQMPALIAENNALNSPIGRNLVLSDIIPLLTYLLSDQANAITGQNFVINGGR